MIMENMEEKSYNNNSNTMDGVGNGLNGHPTHVHTVNSSNNASSGIRTIRAIAPGELDVVIHEKPLSNGYMSVQTTSGFHGDSMDDLKDEEDEEEENLCGWGQVTPVSLQSCATIPWFLVFLCIFAITQGITVNGLVYVITTTLERRFKLPSVQSGFISSSYDFSVMVVIIFVTYFGEQRHKPKVLAVGALIFALGSFIFMLPQFTTPPYEFRSTDYEFCDTSRNGSDHCDTASQTDGLSLYFWVFVLAQFLHGLGAAPLYTLGITYIDENVKPKMTSLYIGIFNGASLLGPAFGYVLGGMFLSIYTDLGVDHESLGLQPDSPLFVGAWWMGFILTAMLALSVIIPFLAFPKALPGQKELAKARVNEAHRGAEFSSRAGFGGSLRDFPRATLALVRNAPFMCICAAAATEWFLLAGFAVFAPKFLESQFSLSSSWAALLVGFTVIPAAVGGSIIGGYVVKRFSLKFRGMIRWCLAVITVSFFLLFAFMINCPNAHFAGVTVDYGHADVDTTSAPSSLNHTCNGACYCNDMFQPVCGVDNIIYYSACHAGCATGQQSEGYGNCSCISTPDNFTWDQPMATLGKCDSECEWQNLFLVLLFLIEFFTILAVVPSMTATLRCVPHSQRSFALGLQSLVYRALGTVPGPVVFGAVIDKACLLWEQSCSGPGTCWLYNNATFSRSMLILALCIKAGSLVFFTGALFTYKPPPQPPRGSAAVAARYAQGMTKTNGVIPNGVYRPVTEESSLEDLSNPSRQTTV
ncbi:solute carrier organic anion transporter family member 4A1-like [Diadema antillarum]|uniref:solute carrier organic anion transporter family member 4A1-like n=1 Tax=Diadema antillarum TaxID=105358 RepID=UPI003A8C3D7C